ncbi:unnamed protein product [Mytilus edulis]|uniref:MULE transposase domain-containing protein n=1 Tax=Mytilus edulis TaxID=6550 RepID=A0A8S3SDH4_MYTED|nr:unnamed protein product [Mytilus edulis]
MVQTQNCREIYTNLALDHSMEAPRDLKQIQNFKYNEKKRERPHQQKASNNADDIQTLMSMQHGHPFIKEIVQHSGKPLHHLQCFLDDIPGAQISGKSLVFGSDEEKALTKAIQKCFPDSQQILCTRHIEESFKRHLREVIGEKDPNYNTVLNEVFGVDGLLSSPDDVEFDLKVMELEAKYEYSVPAFQRYFSSSTSSLKNYVWEPPQKDIAPINWKNNSCESMNNILKLSTNWKAPGPYRQTTQNCSITISRYTTSITWPGELCVGSLG